MDILFIHGNYPGQFRNLCLGLCESPDNRVIFLTERKDAKEDLIGNLHIKQYQQHRSAGDNTHQYLKATEDCILRGQAVIRSIDQIIQEGFRPELIIFHGGMGIGMFLKNILPEAVIIGYFEWWFKAETSKNLIKDYDFNMQLSCSTRNLATNHEIAECDVGVVPTKWQKKQFPQHLQSKIVTIFDGIDEKFFYPPADEIEKQSLVIKNRDTKEEFKFDKDIPILSYATRGMETLRGFPEFMRALPYAFNAIEGLNVIIAGADRCAYSYNAPTHNGSWKEHLLHELNGRIPVNRVHFTGS